MLVVGVKFSGNKRSLVLRGVTFTGFDCSSQIYLANIQFSAARLSTCIYSSTFPYRLLLNVFSSSSNPFTHRIDSINLQMSISVILLPIHCIFIYKEIDLLILSGGAKERGSAWRHIFVA